MQASALLGAHRAVVEVEVQVADAGVLLVGDLAEGVPRGQRRVDRHGDLRRVELGAREGERPRGRELEEGLLWRVAALEVRDPDGAVDGRSADRAGALGDDLARTAAQYPLVMDAEEMELRALDRVEHPGVALGGADLADHAVGALRVPVDRADGLAHQRARPAGHSRGVELGRFAAVDDPAHRLHERLDRGAADLVAIEAALPDLARAEVACGPHSAGVELAVGLEHRHPPLAHPELDRPVQRRRSAVAPRTRVHDQTAMPGPDRLGDQLLQHRAHDQLRAVLADRRLHRGGRVDHRDRHVVAELGQRDPGSLTEAVVRRHEEQDPQRPRVTTIPITCQTSHHKPPRSIEPSPRTETPWGDVLPVREGTPPVVQPRDVTPRGTSFRRGHDVVAASRRGRAARASAGGRTSGAARRACRHGP